MEDTERQRQQLRALLQSQGLDLPDERVEQLLGGHRSHLNGARALRDALQPTDEPAHVFVPVRAERTREGAEHGG